MIEDLNLEPTPVPSPVDNTDSAPWKIFWPGLAAMIIFILIVVAVFWRVGFFDKIINKLLHKDVVPAQSTSLQDRVWGVFETYRQAIQNHDYETVNAISTKPITAESCIALSQSCDAFFDQTYFAIKDLNQVSFDSIWIDDLQAIFSSAPKLFSQTDDGNLTLLSDSGVIYFKKFPDNNWRIMLIQAHRSRSAQGLQSQQQQLTEKFKKELIDSDQDGIYDTEENCEIVEPENTACIKTDPNKRDTDGDGYWDSTELIGGFDPNNSAK